MVTRAVLLETAVTVSDWFSFVAPVLMPLKRMSVFGKLTTSATFVIGLSVGGSFTALTVSVKAVLAFVTPLPTVSVSSALPDCSATGTMVTVRFVPLPSKKILLTGTSAGFPDAADIDSRKAGVCGSATVKATVIGVSSPVTCPAMAEMEGRAWPDVPPVNARSKLMSELITAD